MQLLVAALALAAGAATGETVINGSRQILGNWDASAAASTKAARQATSDPATCSEGEIYYNTTSHRHKQCTAANTWAEMGSEPAVGVAMPTEFTVQGSPTTGGTITIGKAAQAGNTVFAGPSDGSAGEPSFRTLVAGDIPARPTNSYYQYVAAKCLSGKAISGFSLPPTNAPAAVCLSGGSTVSAVMRFDAGTTPESIEDHFQLPADWTGQIDAEIAGRSADATHTAGITMQTACMSNEVIENLAFTTSQTAAFAAQPSNGRTTVQLPAVAPAGCLPNSELFFKVTIDGHDLTAPLDLLSIRFTIRRTI